jgi:hypothetical protein
MWNAFETVIGIFEGKKPFESPGDLWEIILKIILKKYGCADRFRWNLRSKGDLFFSGEPMDWIQVF